MTDWNGIHGSCELEVRSELQLRQLLKAERHCLALVDALSATEADFDRNSGAVEGCWPEDLVDGFGDQKEARDELDSTIDCNPILEGLDLGVASISFVLASAEVAIPRASCRSHDTSRSWSPNPTVQFESTVMAFEKVHSLSRQVDGIWFEWDIGRDLVSVVALSVLELIELSEVLFDQVVRPS